nr:uncharacterized protein LOC117220092 [Megalopta genalis]
MFFEQVVNRTDSGVLTTLSEFGGSERRRRPFPLADLFVSGTRGSLSPIPRRNTGSKAWRNCDNGNTVATIDFTRPTATAAAREQEEEGKGEGTRPVRDIQPANFETMGPSAAFISPVRCRSDSSFSTSYDVHVRNEFLADQITGSPNATGLPVFRRQCNPSRGYG